MGIPVFLAIFIVFLLALFFRYRYLGQKRAQQDDEFWDKERSASSTVRPAPGDDEYAVIPLSSFAFSLTDKDGIPELERKIRALSGEKLMNLTGMSNADIKLKYGANHFDEVCRAGEKYDELVGLLSSYGTAIGEAGFKKEATAILEYLVESGCDLKSAWTGLGKLYADAGEYTKLISLIGRIDGSPLAIKNATRQQLQSLLPSEASEEGDDKSAERTERTVFAQSSGENLDIPLG